MLLMSLPLKLRLRLVVEGEIRGGLGKERVLDHLEESPHCTGRKQRRDGTCHRSHSQLKMEQGLDPKPSVT